ncbi:MAG: hypothetical protein LBC49_05675 [Bacteroidales bacterium]|jgi:hypothetical protein|nr:hypothetical protein [Bacteroidales bacterium]
MRTIRFALFLLLLPPFVCNAQKAHRVSGGETGPPPASSKASFRLQEVQSNTTQEYSRNKAFSLDEEAEDESYINEAFITVGAAIPCDPFASYILDDVAQGAKIGAAAHMNYTVWFIKYLGLGIDLNGGFFGYDFSKVPPYNASSGQTVKKTVKTGWNLISFGLSLRTKFPLYKNNIFLTGRVFAQYGMLNSPTSKVSYKTEVGVDANNKPVYQDGSAVLFPQFVSHKFILGGGIGVRMRVKKRLYVLANLDYSYAVSNNSKTRPVSDGRTHLFSNYSAFSVEAGVAYAF